MAGDWIKFEKATIDKPEVYEIAGMLDIDPDAVIGKLLRVWNWFDDQSRDGHAPVTVRSLLSRVTGCDKFVTAMEDVGWMIEENGRLILPNFDRHNGTPAKSRALAKNRKQKSRSCPDENVTEKGQTRDQRREEKSILDGDTTATNRKSGIPTLDQVESYANSLPMPVKPGCAVAFFDTMEACGWITKQGHAVADWRASFRRYASIWAQNDSKGNHGTGNGKPARPKQIEEKLTTKAL